jgi:hypothetical protein
MQPRREKDAAAADTEPEHDTVRSIAKLIAFGRDVGKRGGLAELVLYAGYAGASVGRHRAVAASPMARGPGTGLHCQRLPKPKTGVTYPHGT